MFALCILQWLLSQRPSLVVWWKFALQHERPCECVCICNEIYIEQQIYTTFSATFTATISLRNLFHKYRNIFFF